MATGCRAFLFQCVGRWRECWEVSLSGNICQLVDDYCSLIFIEITGRLGSWLAWLGRFGEQINWPNVVEQIVNYLECICEKLQPDY